MNIQDWFPLGLTGLSPCCPKDSPESSPTSQFEGISYSALSLFYCPTLTSVHDYLKNHNVHYMDLCRQSNVCFLICFLGLSLLLVPSYRLHIYRSHLFYLCAFSWTITEKIPQKSASSFNKTGRWAIPQNFIIPQSLHGSWLRVLAQEQDLGYTPCISFLIMYKFFNLKFHSSHLESWD